MGVAVDRFFWEISAPERNGFSLFPPATKMALRLLNAVNMTLGHLERICFPAFFQVQPPLELIPIYNQSSETVPKFEKKPFDIKKVFDGFLWGVPICRRSIEKRWMRKYGAPRWHDKLIRPKQNLKLCPSTGEYYEEFRLCPKYYAKIKEETKLMQDKIISELGLSPIEKEVVVVYQGEAKEQPDDFFQVIML